MTKRKIALSKKGKNNMDSLDMIECLYKSFNESDSKSRESYCEVVRDYLRNIYKQLNGNQEEIIKGLSKYIQKRIDSQDKYKNEDAVISCIMAGKLLQEVIEEGHNIK